MNFIAVRELRDRSNQVWKELEREGHLVITSNGKPVAVLSAVGEAGLEETLKAIRCAQANVALTSLQLASVDKGLGKLSEKEIDAEIKAARRERKK